MVLLSIDSTKAPQIRNALVKLGVPVLMEKAPATLKDVYAENTLLARVTDRQAGAVKLNASMAKSIKDILAKAKKSSKIRIFHELDDTYYSFTKLLPMKRRLTYRNQLDVVPSEMEYQPVTPQSFDSLPH